MTSPRIERAVEEAVRHSYGRLVALLTRQTRDVAAAEDALSEALRAALETWPSAGVPTTPEAWLLKVARRKLLDRMRHVKVVEAASISLLTLAERTEERLATKDRVPDYRLELMLACCHPAVDADIRTPLILQTVLGIDAASIASAFLIPPATMGQRLSRAKARIKQAGINFELPERSELETRLEAVLSSIYAAFSLGFDSTADADGSGDGFTEEALYLARLVAELLPEEPEALGLAALLLHIQARRQSRSASGRYVPLDAQDPALWDRQMIGQAEALLGAAGGLGKIGRFQLEAAIQSVHAGRLFSGKTEWSVIAQLYEGLARLSPSVGAMVGQAIAISHLHQAEDGLALLDRIPPETVVNYQPYWAAKAALLAQAGKTVDAGKAYDRAIGLAKTSSVRDFLTERKHELANNGIFEPL